MEIDRKAGWMDIGNVGRPSDKVIKSVLFGHLMINYFLFVI